MTKRGKRLSHSVVLFQAKQGPGAKRGRKKLEVYTYEEYNIADADVGWGPPGDEGVALQCYGPMCVEPARSGSKYCSDECGLKLATK